MPVSAAAPVLHTIVVLTYNRKDVLAELLLQLQRISRPDVEVVVVDNCSTDGTEEFVKASFPNFTLVRLPINMGAVGRNRGMAIARGSHVITIDDDILGLDVTALEAIASMFAVDSRLGAVCFRVIDHYSGLVCNWCHPRDPQLHGETSFETNEITEGAVAFRREVLDQVGLYPDEFFISHEGADLAARIIDRGYEIRYTPQVTVSHKYAQNARPGWRRYYYDTRNDFWLAIRNYSPLFIMLHLVRRLPATFIYAVRDGFLHYWVKAVGDALLHLPEMMKQRRPISREAHLKLRLLNKEKPGLGFYLKKRLFAKRVKI
ncbi:glycosyltransferase family 2 protein [Geotalea toluenoxydans]|uniref:glycosyltransferase family 2 protein n=1 Tax=Geotalea toluenoxydans TaxID=421624 RepID=UPI0006D010FC|nr:glycosyltransferase [Geotalea toluenoxydans]